MKKLLLKLALLFSINTFQNPKKKILFPLQEIKIQKEVGDQSDEKFTEKKEKEDGV